MAGNRWSRGEQDMLESLYRAGLRWDAIAARVGSGRTVTACKRKAGALGLTDPARLGWRRLPDDYSDDLKDLMVLDYSLSEMAAELSGQYGRQVSADWVYKRIRELDGSYYAAWRKRAGGRISRANERAWTTRRRVA